MARLEVKMKVLVFGGTGWVGHHIVLKLAGTGYDVTIVSRGQKKSFVDPVSSIPAITADKHSEEDVKNIFQTRYDAVIDTVPTNFRRYHRFEIGFPFRSLYRPTAQISAIAMLD